MFCNFYIFTIRKILAFNQRRFFKFSILITAYGKLLQTFKELWRLREGLQRKSFVKRSGTKIVAECPTEFNEKCCSYSKRPKRGHDQKKFVFFDCNSRF